MTIDGPVPIDEVGTGPSAVTSSVMQLAFIPSPDQGVWHIGPFPLRAYAMMIIIGVIVAVWLGEKRYVAKGGAPGVVIDVAVWAVPFGLIGGRLYHVITDYQMYFGEGKEPLDALKIWNGGLGIWGAVAMGALGAWIGCRSKGVRLAPLGDAIAPGIALAQGIGRWGNWWNQELYGRPSTLPWAVEIDYAHRPKDSLGAVLPEYENVATYHPTFLYESIWCVALALVVIWAGKKWNLNHGRSFALYVAGYTVGRGWIEALRIDTAHEFFGLRLNDYTSIIVFLAAAAYLYLNRNKGDVPEPITLAKDFPDDPAHAEDDQPLVAETSEEDETEAADEPVAAAEDEEEQPEPESESELVEEEEAPAAESAVPEEAEAVEEPAAEESGATAPADEPAEPEDAEAADDAEQAPEDTEAVKTASKSKE